MQAQERITFSVESSIIDRKPMGHGYPKSPMRPPVVYIENNTLTFIVGHPEYVLTIKGEDDEPVYTTIVSSAEPQVLLPTSLTGSYMIELTLGGWKFVGCIELPSK